MKWQGIILAICLSSLSLPALAVDQVLREETTPPAAEGAIPAEKIAPLLAAIPTNVQKQTPQVPVAPPQPTVQQPTTDQQTAQLPQPATMQPTTQQPMNPQPMMQAPPQPVVQQPVTQQPVAPPQPMTQQPMQGQQ